MPDIVWRQQLRQRPQNGGRVLCATGITATFAARGEKVPAGCRARGYAKCAQVSAVFLPPNTLKRMKDIGSR